ncbi:MAG: hypothetical protein RL701_6481 [Pseudomonadota bacterium]
MDSPQSAFGNCEKLIARVREEEDALVEITCVLRNRLLRSGLEDIHVPAQPQRCSLVKDPYDGSITLVGEWRRQRDKVIGTVLIHQNGQVYAELDVLRPLPNDDTWFVDAVVAFGTPGNLRTELRLTAAMT